MEGYVYMGLYRLFTNVYTQDCFVELEVDWRTLGMLYAFVGFNNYRNISVVYLGE